eukprot:PhF_6_TR12283/c0_g1_i1/m.19494
MVLRLHSEFAKRFSSRLPQALSSSPTFISNEDDKNAWLDLYRYAHGWIEVDSEFEQVYHAALSTHGVDMLNRTAMLRMLHAMAGPKRSGQSPAKIATEDLFGTLPLGALTATNSDNSKATAVPPIRTIQSRMYAIDTGDGIPQIAYGLVGPDTICVAVCSPCSALPLTPDILNTASCTIGFAECEPISMIPRALGTSLSFRQGKISEAIAFTFKVLPNGTYINPSIQLNKLENVFVITESHAIAVAKGSGSTPLWLGHDDVTALNHMRFLVEKMSVKPSWWHLRRPAFRRGPNGGAPCAVPHSHEDDAATLYLKKLNRVAQGMLRMFVTHKNITVPAYQSQDRFVDSAIEPPEDIFCVALDTAIRSRENVMVNSYCTFLSHGPPCFLNPLHSVPDFITHHQLYSHFTNVSVRKLSGLASSCEDSFRRVAVATQASALSDYYWGLKTIAQKGPASMFHGVVGGTFPIRGDNENFLSDVLLTDIGVPCTVKHNQSNLGVGSVVELSSVSTTPESYELELKLERLVSTTCPTTLLSYLT